MAKPEENKESLLDTLKKAVTDTSIFKSIFPVV
jgi:hypothetical protein